MTQVQLTSSHLAAFIAAWLITVSANVYKEYISDQGIVDCKEMETFVAKEPKLAKL